jgi:hypothetical protein
MKNIFADGELSRVVLARADVAGQAYVAISRATNLDTVELLSFAAKK